MSSLPKSCTSSRESQILVPVPLPGLKADPPLLHGRCVSGSSAFTEDVLLASAPGSKTMGRIQSQWEDSKSMKVSRKAGDEAVIPWQHCLLDMSWFCSHCCLLLLFLPRSSPSWETTGSTVSSHLPTKLPCISWGCHNRVKWQGPPQGHGARTGHRAAG